MIYFIPAWYSGNTFKENEQEWYKRRLQSEVDDTVKQIQLMDRNSIIASNSILLNHAPNFRHFLHRQGLLHSNYWSTFDAIQKIKIKRPAVFSYHDLSWPNEIEFIYSPFCISAYLEGKKYAQIDFGEDGNMIQIDMYQNDMISRRNIYDDRGFLSSTIVYRNGKWVYEQYLNEKGTWMICHYNDGHVDINTKENKYLIEYKGTYLEYPYLKTRYNSLEEVIKEVLTTYLKLSSKKDIFVIAMHNLHSNLLLDVLSEKKMVLSFYKDRCVLNNNEAAINLVKNAKAIVVDSNDTYKKSNLLEQDCKNKTYNIPPFDCRVDFGISQQLKEQNILLAVDSLSDEVYEKIIVILMNYMMTNKNVRVNLFTRNSTWNIENRLLENTRNILDKYGFDPDYARKEVKSLAENDLEEEVPVLFYVKQCVDELSVSTCLKAQRLVIDMGLESDLFLQIGSISMGIPQIVRRRTEYVIDYKNGRVINKLSLLDGILHFYLDTLGNWNDAMIASYEIGKQFSSDNLVKWWKGVIDYVEQN